MIFFKKIKFEIQNKSPLLFNRGMTYIELIVVLSIFAIVTSTVLFNYKDFQEKVDIKNLTNEVALKIFEMQKNALSGKLPGIGQFPGVDPWKPSYGIYFNYSLVPHGKVFYTFVDLNQDGYWDEVGSNNCPVGECIDKVTISKGNMYDQDIIIYQENGGQIILDSSQSLNITFTRPDSRAVFRINNQLVSGVNYAKIIFNSANSVSSAIKIYASGRIQLD